MTSTEKASEITGKPDEQHNPPAAASEGGDKAAVNETTEKATPTAAVPEADDDSDWEDLDEVLDDFNQPKQQSSTAAAASKTKPTGTIDDLLSDLPPNLANAGGNFNEEEFLKMLESDMLANLVNNGGDAGGTSKAAAEAEGSTPDLSVDEVFKAMSENGISIEKLIGSVIAESFKNGENAPNQSGSGNNKTAEAGGIASSSSADASGDKDSFQNTIQKTLERMQESGDKATAAAAEDDDSENFLAKLLQAVGDDEDGLDINEIVSSMMEQLANKEMLYQPMVDLNEKYGPWLEANRSKVSAEELESYETQARLVREIVEKFEEKDYSDDKPECAAYIWDRMQAMQAAGSPPEDIIPNPLTDMPSGGANDPVPPDCRQQ